MIQHLELARHCKAPADVGDASPQHFLVPLMYASYVQEAKAALQREIKGQDEASKHSRRTGKEEPIGGATYILDPCHD